MSAQATPGSSSVRPGEVLAGKYRVDRVLGEGGMGVVVAAHHLQLDTRVAIKFLLPHMLVVPEAVGRFAREARAAAKITSEHVARVSDVGALENGSPYMVMEFLEGGDLSAWLLQRGRLEVGQAVDFVLQACEAIAEAHKLGIVHRDLKPANLFCIQRADASLCIKVLDFGISKFQDAASSGMSVTKTTAVMGSPLYMSREQITASRDVDGRSDIWSLGVILFELITGRTPFVGEQFSELCVKIATEDPPPLRSLRPEAPEGLEAVIRRCLEKERDRRFANVGEFAQALAPFAPEHARASVVRVARVSTGADLSISSPSYGTASPGMAMSDAGLGRTTSGQKRGASAGLVAGLSVAATVAVGAVVFAVMSHGAKAKDDGATPASSQPAAPPSAPAASVSAPQAPPSATAVVVPAPTVAPVETAATTTTKATIAGGGAGHTKPQAGKPPLNAGAAAPPPSAAAMPAPAKPATKPGCDPPYTLDENGDKHFKPQCY